ncbi:MAG: MBL fold metallo-hydrolase [Oscillospiraceae bacterium]|nr:MBL fold metallo-hydrolase [Oscillospiraceae bacterium]
MPKRKTAEKNKAFIAISFLIAIIALLFSIFGNWNQIYELFGLNENELFEASEGVSVHFIDVGQGDCALIITPENNILIDSGERDYCNAVLNYLKTQNVKKLDFVIASHPHSDHIGGLGFIIDELGAERIIMPDVKDELVPTTSSFNKLIDSIYENDTEVIYAKNGMTFNLGNGAEMEIIAPVNDYNNLNDYSVVMRFTYAGNSFLFTGDIENAAENDILDGGYHISADVLKIAHHGSSTSSSARFLNQTGGQFAVICVGSPNSYNHPNEKVIDRILNRDYKIFRTDINGHIVFDCTKDGLQVHIQKEM